MKPLNPNEGIAIIGIGAVMPDALDAKAFWDNIVAGKDSIGEVPASAWDWRLYYSEDRKEADKTYSKIGGFIRDFTFDPLKFRIPPGVAAQMDLPQKYAVEATRQALADAGYDKRPFNNERTAVVLGNSMGGTKKEASDLRVYSNELRSRLTAGLDEGSRTALLERVDAAVAEACPAINEDSMPGELSNVIAGRVANVFNLHGSNYTVDAACASSLAAVQSAIQGLRLGQYDMVVCGGVDQMMGASAFIKFSKIGALSADGSYPFDARANGFVMGEGVGVFLLKRVSDAVRDGDRIYAVIRAVGASSDGRGKGITAPNPKGQKLAIENAFRQLDYTPGEVSLIEAHGTSTRVGDRVEAGVLAETFGPYTRKTGQIALGSVKSQIGHLKAAAGAAAVIKMALALEKKVLPPSINYESPNPEIDFADSPLRVQVGAAAWDDEGKTRRGNVSSFGFGGTNFHVAMEEYKEGSAPGLPDLRAFEEEPTGEPPRRAEKLQGAAFVFAGETPESLLNAAETLATSEMPAPFPMALKAQVLNVQERGAYVAAIAAESPAKLREKVDLLKKNAGNPANWKRIPNFLKAKSVYMKKQEAGAKPKIAFLFPGQGSQYVDMLADLRDKYQIVADTFAEADLIMKKIIGETLTDILFTQEGESEERTAERQERIKRTEITQPAVLTADIAILRLLRSFGVEADVVAGHSLGEYGALVAAGVMRFEDALYAVSARGREMADVRVPDPGKMAGISAPVSKVEEVLKGIEGYVTCANKNCHAQTVIAGETAAVEAAVEAFSKLGIPAQVLQVSHAFHSEIVAPAQDNYRRVLDKIEIRKPSLPILSNVTAGYYPEDVQDIRNLLVKQIASEVEWIGQIERMYADGVRLFVEVGPKRVLSAFVVNTLEGKKDVVSLSSNHPKRGGIHEFNDLLARLSAEGIPLKWEDKNPLVDRQTFAAPYYNWAAGLGKAAPAKAVETAAPAPQAAPIEESDYYAKPLAVSGISAGVPGSWDKFFRDSGLDEILRGQNLIEKLAEPDQLSQLEKNIVRLVKSADGDASFSKIESTADVIKLAARAGDFDLESEFGLGGSIGDSLDRTTAMAIGAGLKALHDAGIPLVRQYKTTTIGTQIPTGWSLPESMQEDTGVIFASAFPNLDGLIEKVSRALADKYNRKPLEDLQDLFDRLSAHVKDPSAKKDLEDWNRDWLEPRREALSKEEAYTFSRDFLLNAMAMGHTQFAQFINARGPAFQLSAACASTTTATAVAEDWLRLGRAKRVIVIAADDATSPNLWEWIGTGFLITGAATTKGNVSEAALPFDKRRHGMIVGMGAASLVIERQADVEARGMRPLAELVATQFQNSAFHATRLHRGHIKVIMDNLLKKVEKRTGLKRAEMAKAMLFMSHETYTPARGGSASAEVDALKANFGDSSTDIVVCNTKGFHGHTMGASLEDVVAIRAMNQGMLPPIANYKEPDPELAGITLSPGGEADIKYALRLGAGFGSQTAMSFTRRLCYKQERVADAGKYQDWLKAVSGQENPVLETVLNTLRVQETATAPAPARKPAPVAVMSNGELEETAAVETRGTLRMQAMEETEKGQTLMSEGSGSGGGGSTPPAPAGSDLNEDKAREAVLEIVMEKTGYPADMLELDLDMEADLGIDTVKQAEIFGLLREKFEIPVQEGLSIKDYPTLRHVIGWLSGDKAEETPQEAQPQRASAGTVGAPEARAAVLDLVMEKTGYPEDMLELDLDMEADLGIDTVKQAEIFGMLREKFNLPAQEGLSIKDYPTLRHVIGWLENPGTPSGSAQSTGDEAPEVVADLETAASKTKSDKTKVWIQSSGTQSKDGAVDVKVRVVTPPPGSQQIEDAGAAAGVTEAAATRAVLAQVMEKTGYPEDMLELDLDMEADLGIDTVKQAELFGLIREAFQIPPQEGLQLKDYPTLRHVIRFVVENAPEGASVPAQSEATSEAPEARVDIVRDPAFKRWVLRSEPAPFVEAQSKLELPARAPVLVLAHDGKSARAYIKALSDKGLDVYAFCPEDLRSPQAKKVDLADHKTILEQLETWQNALGKFQGVVFAPARVEEGTKTKFANSTDRYLTVLFHVAKQFGEEMKFFLSVTRIDGRHGLGRAKPFLAHNGAVAGFTKSLSKELPGAKVKVVDVDPKANITDTVEWTLKELFEGDAKREVGYENGERNRVVMKAEGFDPEAKPLALEGAAILITGGGQGLGAELGKRLARIPEVKLYIVGRTELAPEAESYAKLTDAELAAKKKEMWADLKEMRGAKATPVLLEREFAKITKAATLWKNLDAMKRAGASVQYFAADVADEKKFVTALQMNLRGRQIDAVIHAAGLDVSKLLKDKSIQVFENVFYAKASGADVLSRYIKGEPPIVFFSSVSGRFGNFGQTDYAAANDYLAKLARNLKREGRRAVAVHLTAFADIGMATRGGVETFLKEKGVGFLKPAQGVEMILEELLLGDEAEVMLAGPLGGLDEDGQMADADLAGPADSAAPEAAARAQGAPLYDATLEMEGATFAAQAEFSLDKHPYLDDHRVAGTPYVPGVMGLELFARAAGDAKALEDVRYSLPIKLLRDRAITPRVVAQADGTMKIESDFISPAGIKLGAPRTHFTAKKAEPSLSEGWTAPEETPGTDYAADKNRIYELYFHGPRFQVLKGICKVDAGEVVAEVAKPKSLWDDGAERELAFSPMLVEAAFQTCGFRDLEVEGRMMLPDGIEKVEVTGAKPKGRVFVKAAFKGAEDDKTVYDAWAYDEKGTLLAALRGYRAIGQ